MNKTAISLLLVACLWFIFMMFGDLTIPIIELPYLGTLLSIKPFELIAPFSMFLAAFIVIFIFTRRSKQQ